MRTTFLTVIVAAIALAGPARAADVDDNAGSRFQQGVELYREGSFEGALAEFRRAYQLSPSYRVLYNIAQAQYALRDFVGAHRSLMQYLADGGAEIAGERRTQVEDFSTKLADRIAYLQVNVSEAGADVRVDDVSVGTSPLPEPIAVNLGTRKVTATRPGASAAVRVVTVAGRERVRVDLVLDTVAAGPAAAPTSAPSSRTAPVSLISAAARPTAGGPSRAGLVASVSVTAALAVGTGVSAYLALGAQHEFEDQLKAFPTTNDKIEAARSHSRTMGIITDALGAATLVSGGVALYMVLARHGRKPAKEGVALVPTLNGVLLRGDF